MSNQLIISLLCFIVPLLGGSQTKNDEFWQKQIVKSQKIYSDFNDSYIGDLESNLTNYCNSSQHKEETSISIGIVALSNNNVRLAYMRLGNLISEQERFMNSLRSIDVYTSNLLWKAEANGNNELAVSLKLQQALILNFLDSPTAAIDALKKTVAFAYQHFGDTSFISAMVHYNLGYVLFAHQNKLLNVGGFRNNIKPQTIAATAKMAEESIDHLQRALIILKGIERDKTEVGGRIFFVLGNVYHFRQMSLLALENYQQAAQIYLRSNTQYIEPNLFYQIGNASEMMGLYDQALYYYKSLADTDQPSDMLNNRIGNVYLKLGDYDRALDYFNSALNHWNAHKDSVTHYQKHIASGYDNLGMVAFYRGQYATAESYFIKSTKIWSNWYGPLHWDVAYGYQQMARAQAKLGNQKEALKNLEKGLTIRKKLYGKKGAEIASSYFFMAEIYRETNNCLQAVEYYNLSLNAGREFWADGHPQLAGCYFGLASIALQKGEFKQAELLISEGLFKQKYEVSIADKPTEVRFYSPIMAFQFYQLKSELLEEKAKTYKVRNAAVYLDLVKQALQSVEYGVEIERKIRASFQSVEDKIILGNSANQMYNRAVRLAVQLNLISKKANYKHLAFRFSEMHRARSLHEALASINSRNNSGLVDSAIAQERGLLAKIRVLENKIAVMNETTNKNERVELSNLLFTYKREYEGLIEKIEQNNPQYYQLKHQTKIATVADIQKQMAAKNEMYVAYYFDEKQLYTFVVTPQDFKIKSTILFPNFKELLLRFLTKINNNDIALNQLHNPTEIKRFATESHFWYNTLLGWALDNNTNEPQRLVIVADNILNRLPFEVLLTSKVPENKMQFQNLPYLILKYAVRYEYSGTIYLQTPLKIKPTHPKIYGGFAPIYSNSETRTLRSKSKFNALRDELSPLKYNTTEVQTMAALFDGDVFIGERANTQNFKAELNNYKILHLAMHAFVNDTVNQLSALFFNDTKNAISPSVLYTEDIYALQMETDLLVLSACNTNVGEFVSGEGTMSLARAFRYAGCQNIVTSLWQVDDEAASQLMERFFGYIKKGHAKDDALRHAKIEYLKEAKNPHPFYWGAFVLLGQPEPLFEKHRRNNWWLLLGLPIIVFLGFKSIKKNKHHAKN